MDYAGVIGGDPGGTGAIACITSNHCLVYCMKHEHLTKEAYNWSPVRNLRVGLELVGPQPHDTPLTAWQFGDNRGTMYGILITKGLTVELVASMTWKAEFRLLSPDVEHAQKKRDAKVVAQELFPETTVTLWNADAILIAEYMWRKTFGELTHGQDKNRILKPGTGITRIVRRDGTGCEW